MLTRAVWSLWQSRQWWTDAVVSGRNSIAVSEHHDTVNTTIGHWHKPTLFAYYQWQCQPAVLANVVNKQFWEQCGVFGVLTTMSVRGLLLRSRQLRSLFLTLLSKHYVNHCWVSLNGVTWGCVTFDWIIRWLPLTGLKPLYAAMKAFELNSVKRTNNGCSSQ